MLPPVREVIMSLALLFAAMLVAASLGSTAVAQDSAAVAPTEAEAPAAFLQAGDRAVDFDLPAGNGERLVLSELLKREQPIFLLTFRSSW